MTWVKRIRRDLVHGGSERGSTSLELTILFPVLLLLVFALVQFGLWFHARGLALAAAQEGVSAARLYQATPGAGVDRATDFLTAHGSDTLLEAQVNDGSSALRVRIEVTGRALSVLPGVSGLSVSQHAEGPVERFIGGTP